MVIAFTRDSLSSLSVSHYSNWCFLIIRFGIIIGKKKVGNKWLKFLQVTKIFTDFFFHRLLFLPTYIFHRLFFLPTYIFCRLFFTDLYFLPIFFFRNIFSYFFKNQLIFLSTHPGECLRTVRTTKQIIIHSVSTGKNRLIFEK